MKPTRATIAAIAATALAYLLIAWLASRVTIPAGAPSARVPWIRPFRVVAEVGFVLGSLLHLPHVVGQLLAAILLGGLLGGVYATVRVLTRS